MRCAVAGKDTPFKDREIFNVKMTIQNTFVGVSFLRRDAVSDEAFQVAIHRSEARLLCERLLSLLEKPDGAVAMIEGAYSGPPPTADDLVGSG
jgi:hypothetical protein